VADNFGSDPLSAGEKFDPTTEGPPNLLEHDFFNIVDGDLVIVPIHPESDEEAIFHEITQAQLCNLHKDCGIGYYCLDGVCVEDGSKSAIGYTSGTNRCGELVVGSCPEQGCDSGATCGTGGKPLTCCGKPFYHCPSTDAEGKRFNVTQCEPCNNELTCYVPFCVDPDGNFAEPEINPLTGEYFDPIRCQPGHVQKEAIAELSETGECPGLLKPVEEGEEENEPVRFNPGCDPYCHDYFKTYGQIDTTFNPITERPRCSETDHCKQCETCDRTTIGQPSNYDTCNRADPSVADIANLEYPCWCQPGNDGCPECEHCETEDPITAGFCFQRGGQDCVNECNCLVKCDCGVVLEGRTTTPYFGYEGPVCAERCRAGLLAKCDQFCPEEDTDPCAKDCESTSRYVDCDFFENGGTITDLCPPGKNCRMLGFLYAGGEDGNPQSTSIDVQSCQEGGKDLAIFLQVCDQAVDNPDCFQCDCHCSNDCGDCEICGDDGTCQPDPACANTTCLGTGQKCGSRGGPCRGCCPPGCTCGQLITHNWTSYYSNGQLHDTATCIAFSRQSLQKFKVFKSAIDADEYCAGLAISNPDKACCSAWQGVQNRPECHSKHCDCRAKNQDITWYAAGACGTVFAVASGGRIELKVTVDETRCYNDFDVKNGLEYDADSPCGYDECAAVGFPS